MPIVIEPPAAPPVEAPKDDGSNLWELLYESLAPLNDPDPDETLLKFCQAWCVGMQPVYDLVRERDDLPSWGVLFDVDQCPVGALPYLAQYVGVEIRPEWTEEQIRTEIAEPTGWRRGQIPSIEAATRRHLTGTKRVVLKVNTPERGFLYIRVLKSECLDEALTLADIKTQKPAWMVLDFATFDGLTFADLDANYADNDAVDTAFDQFADIPTSALP